MLLDKSGDLVRALRLRSGHERRHQRRQRLANRIAAHPVEQLLARRLLRGRMRKPQQVAVRPASALTVLHRLQRKPVHRLPGVPRSDTAPEPAPPAAQALDGLGELEQVRARAADPRDRRHGEPLGLVIANRRRECQCEDRGIVLGRTARMADLHDTRNRTRAILLDRADGSLRVLTRERPLGCVVAAALGAQHQEAVEARPVVNREREAASRVRDRAGDRLGLRSAAERKKLRVVDHGYASSQ